MSEPTFGQKCAKAIRSSDEVIHWLTPAQIKFIDRLYAEASGELMFAAQEALVAIGALKIAEQSHPILCPELREQLMKSHHLLLTALTTLQARNKGGEK